MNTEAHFMALVSKFSSSDPEIILGKMMSSPALKYRDRVFAFYHKHEMGFRLGPGFDPKKSGIRNARPLSPFKTKPPLRGWYIIAANESNTWEFLTGRALDFTMSLDN
ncbi:MAG TPA: hypothetical protein VKN36_14660 [Eudoraea sp.]|nr:hypothetical protein [Eudoraea sp.]